MNFFFGISDKELKCQLTIAKFQNKSNAKGHSLFSLFIENNKWKISEINCDNDEHFYYLNNSFFSKSSFYFLAKKNEIKKFDDKRLVNLNRFTDTLPAFRANMKIYNDQGGFSSYQSEYPFSMVTKTGSILSPVLPLTNINADKNLIYLPNLHEEPRQKEFEVFLVDLLQKKVLLKKKILTNCVNCFDVEREFIKPDVFLFTKEYLAVPVFVSSKDFHLSCEHTHPPLTYIMSKDRFTRIAELKKEVNEIIN